MQRAVSKKKKNDNNFLFDGMKVLEICAKRIEVGSETNNEVVCAWKLEIDKFTENEAVMVAGCKTAFEPSGYFELHCKYEIKYTHEGMTQEAFEKKLPLYARPCLSMNTMIMAELSSHIMEQPLIIPPIIRNG